MSHTTPSSNAVTLITSEQPVSDHTLAMALSTESRALRRSNIVFKRGVDPDNLVTVLYSNFLLTPEEKSKATLRTLTDSQKLEELFTTLERRVSVKPDDFHKLISVLRDEPAMKAVGNHIQANYDEEKAMMCTAKPHTTVHTAMESTYHYTPLHLACESGCMETVELLLKRDADANRPSGVDGETPLHIASRHANFDIMRVLLTSRVDVNRPDKYKDTPLHIACEHANLDVMKLLLEFGADTNKPNRDGDSSLHIASRHVHLHVLKLLLKSGADPNKPDKCKDAPLHIASRHAKLDVMEVLLESGADANKPDRHGDCPLHIASRHARLDVMKVLLEHGADTNKPNRLGVTPLYWAISHGDIEATRMLVKKGGDPNISFTSVGGHTPLDLARQRGQKEIIQLLLNRQ